MEMGKEIRRLRNDRGLTQEALAAALNVTAQTVSKWECGVSQRGNAYYSTASAAGQHFFADFSGFFRVFQALLLRYGENNAIITVSCCWKRRKAHFMDYREALAYIDGVSWLGSRPGLARVTALLEKLGDPQKELPELRRAHRRPLRRHRTAAERAYGTRLEQLGKRGALRRRLDLP